MATKEVSHALDAEWTCFVVQVSGGKNKQDFIMKQTKCLDPQQSIPAFDKREIFVLNNRELDKDQASQPGVGLWMPIWMSISVLN